MRLKDKVAIITGGSRGIGFATADKFLKEGASVVLAASSQESADVAVDKLKEKYQNGIVAGISPNLASMESVRKAFKEATEKYGCVDILVNNAGISENTSFMDYTEETFDKVIFCGNIKNMVEMIEGLDIVEFRSRIAALEYHGTTAVFCEIDKNPYSWIYLPSCKHESHRIICTGNFACSNNDASIREERITATIEFTDKISKETILDNLSRIPLNPKYLTHHYNQCTYPIQDTYTREMIKQLKANLAPTGFYFTGRFADWEYYNMDLAMGAAMDLCNSI